MGRRKRTHEEYVNEVSTINPNIEVVGKYSGSLNKILHKCKIDGTEWFAQPNSILHGSGCPMCGGSKQKTHEEYVEEVYTINKNIEVIESYITARTKIKHRCKLDGCVWETMPTNVLKGQGCPKCFESSGEKVIANILDNKEITYIRQHTFSNCKDQKVLPFDFYIPSKNMCIEFDGKQHFEPIEYFGGQEKFEIQIKHDKIKDNFCKENGISLLRIPYYKYNNIEEELNNFLFI